MLFTMSSPSLTVSVQRIVRAAASDVFVLITDPARHSLMDATGSIQEAITLEPLREVGQPFVHRIAVEWGDQVTVTDVEYKVSRFVPERSLEWSAPEHGPFSLGWRLRVDLDPLDELTTRVTMHFIWNDAAAAAAAEPLFSAVELAACLDAIADAVEKA